MRSALFTDYPRETASNTLAKDHQREIARHTSDTTRPPIAYAVVRRERAAELTKKPLDGRDGRTLKIELRQFQVGGGKLDGAPHGKGNRVVRFCRLIIAAEKIVRALVVPCDPHGAKSLLLLAAGEETSASARTPQRGFESDLPLVHELATRLWRSNDFSLNRTISPKSAPASTCTPCFSALTRSRRRAASMLSRTDLKVCQ